MDDTAPARLVSSDVREHNRALVLHHLDRHGPAARSEIAAATGLVRGAVTSIAAELLEEGLVRHAQAAAQRSGAGRPVQPLELDGSGLAVVAVQLLLDEHRWLVTDLAGRVLAQGSELARTPIGEPEAVADALARRVSHLTGALRRRGVRPVRVQVVAPGPVLADAGTVYRAVDLGWRREVDLRGLVAARLPARSRLPVTVLNDANCATWAEFRELRAAPGLERVRDVVYVKADTGIGGGAVVAGRLLVGARGTAFEPGHVVVQPAGPPCECGRRGCLVTVAGPRAVLVAAGLAAAAERDGEPAALAELARRYRDGAGPAVGAVRGALGWLRQGLDVTVVALDPAVVVLDGYLALLLPELTEGGFPAPAGPVDVVVRRAALGGTAAVRGAVALAREEALDASSSLH
ncbi:ROK family transcriptional regulator [Kineococcus arenarius]|uniref:ROK family transcriptional regulator n=1 Tax=Kineococcus sp. SYSU DK007 TaxID=3383128 RepID=UPI003D7E5C8A